MMNLALLLAAAALAAAASLPNLDQRSNLTPRTAPAEGGGFVKHCFVTTIGERGDIIGRLTGRCGDGEFHTSWLDLNKCLGNENGGLVWQDGGNAIAEACRACRARHFDTHFIECECRDVMGAWKGTSLDLNQGVRYDPDKHVLACYGNYGVSEE